MRGRFSCIAALVVILAFGVFEPAWAGLALVRVAQSSTQRAVEQALRKEKDLRRLGVSAAGSEVTLTGLVPHLFAKNEAIRRALELDGIETVVSEMELPEPVGDADLAKAVEEVVMDYVHYTLWDYFDAYVKEGVVTVLGSVTPDRDKKRELYRDIARIPGVQDYVDRVEVLSPSTADNRLRAGINRSLSRSSHFDRYLNQRNLPFHIIINNSVVTLKGYVRNQIEYLEMQRIIAQMGGALRVDNQLEVLSP